MTEMKVVGKNDLRPRGEMIFGFSVLKLLLLRILIDYQAQVVQLTSDNLNLALILIFLDCASIANQDNIASLAEQ